MALLWLQGGSKVAPRWRYFGSKVALKWLQGGAILALKWRHCGDITNGTVEKRRDPVNALEQQWHLVGHVSRVAGSIPPGWIHRPDG